LVAVLLVITPAFYLLEINTVGKSFERSTTDILESAGTTLAASMRSLIEHEDKSEIERAISAMVGESPWLHKIVVTDESLAVLAGYDDNEPIVIGSKLKWPDLEKASQKAISRHSPVLTEHYEQGEPLLSVAAPVFSPTGEGLERASGIVLISYDLNKVRQAANRAILTETAIDILIFAVVLLLLNWLMRRLVVRPVQNVMKAVSRLASGDLEARVPEGDATEIGQLANSFNFMASNIQEVRTGLLEKGRALSSTHEALEQAYESLESQTHELQRTNHDLQLVAYVGSHDLKEPLRMISVYLGLIQKQFGKLDRKDFDELLAFPLEGAKRMSRLIDDLMQYLKTGSEHLETELVDLSGIVEGLKRDIKISLEETSGKIIASDLPVLQTNPTLVRQLLQNLISNSIKFRGDKAPLIRITAERGKGEWIISVKDNGMGYDPSQASGIFDPFRRLHSRSEAPGSGLGLAICKRITDILGGRIWTSSRVGEGATFSFSLPDSQAHDAERELEPLPERKASGDRALR
jgi:signal transduction histidine kinase